MCIQWKLRSACVSAQSGRSLPCHMRHLDLKLYLNQRSNNLVWLSRFVHVCWAVISGHIWPNNHLYRNCIYVHYFMGKVWVRNRVDATVSHLQGISWIRERFFLNLQWYITGTCYNGGWWGKSTYSVIHAFCNLYYTYSIVSIWLILGNVY